MTKSTWMRRSTCVLLAALVLLPSCQTAYYNTLEKFGYHKRDLLIREVRAARDEQEDAKEEFRSALEQFRSVVEFEGGELEKQYNLLNAAYERSNAQAEAVRARIDSVEDVAEALFREWDAELDQYESAELRTSSESKLRVTRRAYEGLLVSMRRAEARMDPVLARLHDQVLFLKHNLNASAIASLEGTVVTLQVDVSRLVDELERSIAEANAFIKAMGIEG